MPDHAPELGHRRAVRDLEAGMRRPVGHEPHGPCLAIRRQHGLEGAPVLRDHVRRQVRDAVRQHRPDEVDRLPAGPAQLDPLSHATARRSSAVIAQRSSRPADSSGDRSVPRQMAQTTRSTWAPASRRSPTLSTI